MKRDKYLFAENPIELNKKLLWNYASKGGIYVDATCGNGLDTLFLCQLAKQSGKVYGFDIQELAIKNTEKLLEENNVKCEYKINLLCHSKINSFVTEEVDLIMFNLGYLPKSDKSITTIAQTTIQAIIESLKLLKKNGLVSLIAYRTHDSDAEHAKLVNFFKKMDQNKCNIIKFEFVSRESAPILYIIEKLEDHDF